MTSRGIRPRDIVTPPSLRNALTVAIAMGGSTNVVLHSVEIARAAGIDLWAEVLSQSDFNALSRRLPVLVNMRPFGDYSMVDVDAKGGLQVIVKELLDAGFLDGDALTCTGETLAEQVRRLDPPPPDRDVIYPVDQALQGHRRTASAAGKPRARGWRDPQGCRRRGRRAGRRLHRTSPRVQRRARPRSRPSTASRTPSRTTTWWSSATKDPAVRPGMPELLDPTSRITALCRERDITIALMTDARFSGGSVGLVIGHVAPEAFLGGPIALVEDGDTIVIDVTNDRMDCTQLDEPAVFDERARRGEPRSTATAACTPTPARSRTGCWRACEPRRCRRSSAPGWRHRRPPDRGRCRRYY